jgi:hypothetical protein
MEMTYPRDPEYMAIPFQDDEIRIHVPFLDKLVENVAYLYQQVTRLNEENSALKERVAALEKGRVSSDRFP